MSGAIKNEPTEIGYQMGSQLSDFYDAEFAKRKANFPKMEDGRCRTCAFRKGSRPNGCETTLMDATKCIIEMKEFGCHETQKDGHMCFGWFILANAVPKNFPVKEVSWEFSSGVERATESDG